MRILTTDETREAAREATSRAEISTLVLMQRAGYAVAQFCVSQFKFRSVCVVCGKGNNGGDGLVAAQALKEIVPTISVLILAKDVSELSPDAAAMRARLKLEPVWIASEADLDSHAARNALGADLIIDAIVGTGFKPPLRGLAKKAVDAINDAMGDVVAVDLPSGVDADSRTPVSEDTDMVFAQGIVTFIAPKPAHVFGELTSGPIAVSEIGVQPALVSNKSRLEVTSGMEVGMSFPPRAPDAHKGEFGHVLVIGGSTGKSGAAVLAGLAALRTGAGLVTVACPKSVQPIVATSAPELMTEPLPETPEGTISTAASEKLEALIVGKDAIVLGPGLSRNEETGKVARRLATRAPVPLVLDADGLNAFDGHYNELKAHKKFLALTPHPGEAARLLGITTEKIQEQRLEMAKRLAADTGACVVLKGHRTIVAGASEEIWFNLTGNPALAKGGSGDVLSGIIGASLAREPSNIMFRSVGQTQLDDFREHQGAIAVFFKDVRVAAAVHLHGLTGDFARDMLHENTVLATDQLHNLSE